MSSNNQLKVVEEHELPDIINEVKKYMPQSLTIYGYLCAGFNYKTVDANTTKIYIPADIEASFFIVICEIPIKGETPSLNTYWDIESIRKTVIVDYLASLPELNWKQPIIFALCEQGILRELKNILLDNKLCGTYLNPYEADQFRAYLLKDNVVVPNFSLPDYFELDEIDPKDAEKVFEFWHHSTVERSYNMSTLLKYLPSSAIFYRPEGSSSRKMVSWTLTKHTGEIGMTHTLAEFRSRKLATIVTYDLISKHQAMSLPSYVTISDDNLISIMIHKKIGFIESIEVAFNLYQDPINKILHIE